MASLLEPCREGLQEVKTQADRGPSLVAHLYKTLHREIVTCEIPPGSRLRLKEIAETHGVSLSVVREAVTRLSADGLVESTPQRGFGVRSLSIEDLEDLTWLRVEVECLAIRESIAGGDLEWASALVAAHYSMINSPIVDPATGAYSPQWMHAHNVFHGALTNGGKRERLKELRQNLFNAAELYRYWSGIGDVDQDVVLAQHQAILDAALARDADKAADLLSCHIEQTAMRLRERIESVAQH